MDDGFSQINRLPDDGRERVRCYGSYIEIGTRSPNERSHYPDVDLEARKVGGSFRFTHRDGGPYET